MSSGVLQCNGEVFVTPDGAPTCSGIWSLVPVPEPFDVSQLDPATVASAFTAGFVIVGSIWFAGWACKALLSLIR